MPEALTENEQHLMLGALGLRRSKKAYRNYFNAPAGTDCYPTWRSLVERGLANARGDDFHVNIHGLIALEAAVDDDIIGKVPREMRYAKKEEEP